MANKKFTDSKKWRNAWFRKLPIKAKIVWSYLCDECESHGVWKADYELASFQVDFDFSSEDLKIWFAERLHFFGNDKVLIVPYFEYQYGESKDTWSAKIQARKKLETLGFSIVDNKVIVSKDDCPTTVVPQWVDGATNLLNTDKDKSKNKVPKGGVGEKFLSQLQEIHQRYPNPEGKTPGIAKLLEDITSTEDITNLSTAVAKYSTHVEGRELKHIKTFLTFAGEWRDWTNFTPPATKSPTIDWLIEAGIYFQAVDKFSPDDREQAKAWLTEARWELIRSLGGLKMVRSMPRDQFSISRLAKQLSAAYEKMEATA